MKILINALSGIGDAVMFSPALNVLKKHLPESQIDMLAMFSQVKEIYSSNKNVNRIYFIDFLHQSSFKSLREAMEIRKNKYDASINVYPSNRKEYNLLNRFFGSKKRIAAKYLNFSFSNFDFLNTDLKKEVQNRHNVFENFDLIKILAQNAKEDELGSYGVKIPIVDEVHATEYLLDHNLNDKLLIGIHAGSATFKRHMNKRWAAKKFIETAIRLHKKYSAHFILFGTETELNKQILKEINQFAIIPEVDGILSSIALIEKCRLFISNDTALMHIASALKIPIIAIFGYTNYQELHPWKSCYKIIRKELDCSPCFFNSPKPVKCIFHGEDEFKCIKTVEVGDVLEAVDKLIEEIPR
jgi:heptosyltransferase-2